MNPRKPALACAALLLLSTLAACTSPEIPVETTDTVTEKVTVDTEEMTTAEEITTVPAEEDTTLPEDDTVYVELIIPKRTQSKFKVIYDNDSEIVPADKAGWLNYFFEMETGYQFRLLTSEREYPQEIVLGSVNRPETVEMMASLKQDEYGYCVGVARSSNGRLDGEWIHEDRLYSRYMTGEFDGGHAMIFTDTDGQMYMSFHSPNGVVGDRGEMAVFLAIREENNKLVWDTASPNE